MRFIFFVESLLFVLFESLNTEIGSVPDCRYATHPELFAPYEVFFPLLELLWFFVQCFPAEIFCLLFGEVVAECHILSVAEEPPPAALLASPQLFFGCAEGMH